MTINEEGRQVAIAAEVEEHARSLAHSTRSVPSPSDSYRLLGELSATADHLAQVLAQLAAWHRHAEDGTHYDGEDEGREGSPQRAADELDRAARAATAAATEIGLAHASNSFVRWYDSPSGKGSAGA